MTKCQTVKVNIKHAGNLVNTRTKVVSIVRAPLLIRSFSVANSVYRVCTYVCVFFFFVHTVTA